VSSTTRTRRTPLPGEGGLAVIFVVLAVVALFVVPQVVERRTGEAQQKIADVLDPARLRASRLGVQQARQMTWYQAFLMTGKAEYQRKYEDAHTQERDIYASLRSVASGLDLQGVPAKLARLSAASERWYVAQQPAFLSDSARIAAFQHPDNVLALYVDVQQGTLDLEAAIQAEVEAGRIPTAELQKAQAWITLVLVVLALCATVVVSLVGGNLRALTKEAQARRKDAVLARREMDGLLEATGDGVLGMDLTGRCTSVNRAGCELLGYPESGLTGRDVHDVLHRTTIDGQVRPRESSLLLQALAKGERVRSPGVDVLWRRDHTPLPVQWSLRPLVDGTALKGGVLTFTDMTEIREKEEALQRAIHVREEVVAIVSHDLRNPLGVVAAAADLLLDLPLDEAERRKQANIIRRSADRMSRLIGDLLEVSRIEAGALVVRTGSEEVRGILEEARSIFAPQARDRNVDLVVDARPDLPPAMVDRDRILQALSNLLANALKVTPGGGRVTLGARATPAGAVEISVADTGPGIAPEAMDRLFDRFWQASRHDRTGSGLGLAIVRGIAEAHRGTVRVDSKPGKGAIFRILLPVAERAPLAVARRDAS
jgi:PAS domain S-box-containing protein